MAKLCLNMIVRNEAARILRALASVADHISCYAILDTGSIDGTPDAIKNYFDLRGIPGEVHIGRFKNFEQARNDALKIARKSKFDYDYLLLMDADMEMVVENKDFRDQLAGALSYDAIQKAGTISYHNRRFLQRGVAGEYRGVTHEYLDVEGGGLVEGVWFQDHADGSNRKDKYSRDIGLLLEGLKKEPLNDRYWFYLAQSYRDAGQFAEAAAAYKKRVALGGWDEEVWCAQMNYAHSLGSMGDEDGFIRNMLVAYNMRPSRAEVLYDLAKHYRLAGMNAASTLCSEAGLKIPRPSDMLFVSDYVYSTGLREEFSITAFYDPSKRTAGFKMCNDLSLDRAAPEHTRELARNNLFHYIEPLAAIVPSFTAHRIPFVPPADWTPLNPSVAMVNGQIVTTVRTVNYTILPSGHYSVKGDNGTYSAEHPIRTRNFLVRLSNKFEPLSSKEIEWSRPTPVYPMVLNMEDMRLFMFQDKLHVSACVREMNQEGWCEQVVAQVTEESDSAYVSEWGIIHPKVRQHEKNWAPWVKDGGLKFSYRLGATVDATGNLTHQVPALPAVERLSGGSQVIPFNAGYLSVVHEARLKPDGQRYYNHRFVLFDASSVVRAISKPFVLHGKQIEFVAGLAWHPDGKRLMLSYGVRDCEAWIATVNALHVLELLHD